MLETIVISLTLLLPIVVATGDRPVRALDGICQYPDWRGAYGVRAADRRSGRLGAANRPFDAWRAGATGLTQQLCHPAR